ncbi:MAG TPA: nucleotidyltransferase substrate binding protein [bacterium]|nr:nucleotidyltransferase substrate binding protein [bacterium]
MKSRNLSSHTYNREIAEKIAQAIVKDYLTEFEELSKVLRNIAEKG